MFCEAYQAESATASYQKKIDHVYAVDTEMACR
jgi:hypothetical protein